MHRAAKLTLTTTLLTALIAGGCAGARPAVVPTIDLLSVKDPKTLKVSDFTAVLPSYLNAGSDAIPAKLDALRTSLGQETLVWREADLNGDGVHEWGGFIHKQQILGTPDLNDNGKPEIVLALNIGIGAAGGRSLTWVGNWRSGSSDQAKEILSNATGAYTGLTEAARQASDQSKACDAAAAWVRQNRQMLDVFNKAPGYGNPQFTAENICGPISFPGLE